MSRVTVRVGVAQLLGGLQNDDGTPMFKAVYPVMPTRIDKTLLPAAFVMLPKTKRKRYGPNQKHADYIGEARVYWSAPSTNWDSPEPGGNVWETPDNEPQTMFDLWLDAFARALEANKSFPQNTPETGVQTILIGEPDIDFATSEPQLEGQMVVLAAIVSFPVKEQILGV